MIDFRPISVEQKQQFDDEGYLIVRKRAGLRYG